MSASDDLYFTNDLCSDIISRKPKTKRGKRALEEREAKINENTKTALFLRGTKTSEVVSQAMKDFVRFSTQFLL